MSRPEQTDLPDRGFDAPWQAQVFAMLEALKQSGRVDGAAWAARLGAELAAHQTGPHDYWDCYMAAFMALLAEEDIARPDDIAHLAAAWQRAAQATPHGQPITLEADPQR